MKVVMIAIICGTLFTSINSSAVNSPKTAAQLRSNGRLEASNRCEKRTVLEEIGLVIAAGTFIMTLWSAFPSDQSVIIEINSAFPLYEPVWYMEKGNAIMFPPPDVEVDAQASIRFDAKSRKWQGTEGALAYKTSGGQHSLVIGWKIPVIPTDKFKTYNKFGVQVVQALYTTEQEIKAKYDANTIPWQTVEGGQEWFVGGAVNGMIVEAAMGNRAQASLRVNLVRE